MKYGILGTGMFYEYSTTQNESLDNHKSGAISIYPRLRVTWCYRCHASSRLPLAVRETSYSYIHSGYRVNITMFLECCLLYTGFHFCPMYYYVSHNLHCKSFLVNQTIKYQTVGLL